MKTAINSFFTEKRKLLDPYTTLEINVAQSILKLLESTPSKDSGSKEEDKEVTSAVNHSDSSQIVMASESVFNRPDLTLEKFSSFYDEINEILFGEEGQLKKIS